MTRLARALARRISRADGGAVSERVRFLSIQTRTEHDLLGEREVAAEAYFGVQTLWALENFQITGVPISHYPSLVTALNPPLGYEVCTALAKEAFQSGRGIKELVLEKKLLSPEELARFLSPEHMVGPQAAGGQAQ